MKLSVLDFNLPRSLIAQKPLIPRFSSKLLILERSTGDVSHHRFFEIGKFLRSGDVLVLNDTKVFPARLFGFKRTKGKVEILLARKISPRTWEALVKGKIKKGLKIFFAKNIFCQILSFDTKNKVFRIKFNISGKKFDRFLEKYGQVPTPPYIKKAKIKKNYYQTVFAHPKKAKSCAAPTAGFHFTWKLLSKLKKMGVQIEFITLHVGPGTFQPIRTKNIEDHQMHPEYAEIKKESLLKLIKAKKKGQRIIACGTTTIRALETILPSLMCKNLKTLGPFKGWLNTFIYPGFVFKIANGLITNFHLPKTTLLALVAAFAQPPDSKDKLAGLTQIKKAYQEAIRKKYRFYSFGDAMFIY